MLYNRSKYIYLPAEVVDTRLKHKAEYGLEALVMARPSKFETKVTEKDQNLEIQAWESGRKMFEI